MQRDDDYIRNLLLEIEISPDIFFLAPLTMSANKDDEKKHYHCELLCDAGLLTTSNNGVYRMTNQGHDYLEAIRSDTIWEKTKAGAAAIGGVTIGMMKEIAISYLKQEAAEKLGIQLK